MHHFQKRFLILSMFVGVLFFFGTVRQDIACGQAVEQAAVAGQESTPEQQTTEQEATPDQETAPAAEKDRQPAHELSAGHKEEPDDSPMKPVSEDQSARSQARIITRGPYVSVQVNVDGLGQNIVGDAGNEPSIAVDPLDPDKMAIGWRQFDTVSSNFRQGGWAYSHDGGQSWTFPGVLTPGTFRSDPVLDFDSAGNFYYYSLQGNFTCDMFISNDSGVTWMGPFPAWGGDKNWLGIDRTNIIGQDHIYCNWTGTDNFTRSTDGGQTYMPPIPSQSMWGTISVGPDGEVYICGLGSGTEFTVQKSLDAQNPGITPTWSSTISVDLGGDLYYGGAPNPGGLLGQIWIATNHSPGIHRGEVYLLASVRPSAGGNPLNVHFSRSTDQGLTWSDPVRINDDPEDNGAWHWFGTMSVAPNGRIDVVWNDTRDSGDPTVCTMYYSYSHDGGQTWSKNVPVNTPWNSIIGWPQQDKIGDYYDMVSQDEYADVAYAATFNDEQDVYHVKVFPYAWLTSDAQELPAGAGGSIDFSLDAGPANQNRTYLLLGTTSGPEPGLPLPGGMATLPITWDWFTTIVFRNRNTVFFSNFLGTLDAAGRAEAQLNSPPLPPSAVGIRMHYAFCCNNPFDFASNPVEVVIVE